LHATVAVDGIERTIEEHYQLSKRFGDAPPPRVWRDAKGKRPTHFEARGIKLPLRLLSAWYLVLWVKYLDQHPELVRYAKAFDAFHDAFARPGQNNQADAICRYVKDGRTSILRAPEVEELFRAIAPARDRSEF